MCFLCLDINFLGQNFAQIKADNSDANFVR